MLFTNIAESVAEHLRYLIIDQKLKPGQKLNEIELASELGISRSPLREAFRVLSGEHLIEIVPRKGSYVTKVSMEDCMEIYEAREMIEFFAVELLKRRGVRKIPEVERALAITSGLDVPVAADAEKKFKYLKHIADFHIKIVEAAGNSKLISYYQYMFPNLARYQAMYVFINGLMHDSQEAHEEIYQLICDGQYDRARSLLREHITSWPHLLEELLSKQGD